MAVPVEAGRGSSPGVFVSGAYHFDDVEAISSSAQGFGTAKIYVATGPAYVCAIGEPALISGAWTKESLDLKSPGFVCSSSEGVYDPRQVNELGIEIDTLSGNPGDATILMDSVIVE